MFFSRHITRNTLTYGQTEFVLAGSLKRKNDITRCFTTCYAVMSCGGRTRTCDLQVMSLASYQLLHSAILIKTNQKHIK